MYFNDKIPFKLSLVNLLLSSFVRLFTSSLVCPFSHDQTYVPLVKFAVFLSTGSAS